jgi:two-component system response regulator (stage 0 sporulation protein F)
MMADLEQAAPALAKAIDEVPEPHGSKSERGPPLHAAPGRILLADDDVDLRTVLREILVEEGYEVSEAADGPQALELLSIAADGSAPLPDVVLLDFVMPGLSGLGILGLMRRLSRRPRTIIMTGFPDPSVEAFARNLGAVCVLRKPIDGDELRSVVFECMPF